MNQGNGRPREESCGGKKCMQRKDLQFIRQGAGTIQDKGVLLRVFGGLRTSSNCTETSMEIFPMHFFGCCLVNFIAFFKKISENLEI